MFNYFDAISKNVFEPYTRQFATLVISLFLETYETVDRGKMKDMNTMEKARAWQRPARARSWQRCRVRR
jgi:hypothetical protein